MATVRIQVRRGTSTQWTSANPTLAAGEIGVETNTRKVKIGDGTTTWTSLDYIAADSPAIGEIAQDAINDALSMGSGLTKSYNDGTNTITVSIDSNVVALKSYVDSEITATEGYADSAVSTHNAVTTSVHGIANTADLATQDYVDNAVSTLQNTVDTTYIPDSEKGQPNGVATLNSNTKIPNAQIDTEVIATRSYTDTAISNLVDGSPELLNTLNELAAAINDDANFSATITNSIGEKVAKSGDTMTGFLTLSGSPTLGLHAASKAYVDGHVSTVTSALETSLGIDIANAETNANNYIDNQISIVNGVTTGLGNDIADLQTDLGTVQQDITTINGTLTTVQSNITTAQGNITTLQQDVIDAKNEAISAAETYTDTAIATEVSNRNSAISSAIGTHESDTTSVHGIADTSALATKTYADSAVSTHEADTTNIHGIADTSALATKTYADSAVSTHNSNTTTAHGVTGAVVGTTNTQTLTNKTLTSPVINSPTGIVKADVGLGNVDNTSDADKPVSTATQSALDLKANLASPTFTGTVVLPSGTVTSGMILDGTIVNADINASAAIDWTKLAVSSTISSTELGYLDGVTSGIQNQIDGKLSLSGGTMTGNLTLSGAPTQDAHAATKSYVDNVVSGINFHQPVRVATTANITLSGTQTIDGISLSVGDRVLVKNQTDQKENGIYVVASSTWSRATDADNTPDGELKGGDFTLVLEGTVNEGYGYVCSNSSAITIGTTNITYAPFNAAKAVTAGTGLTESSPGVLAIDSSVVTLSGTQSLSNKTLVAPALGTPVSGTLTNATGLPVSTGIAGLGSGVATFLATPSAANLAATVTEETGSGALVFANSPTLISPALGTPASGVMTNVTGLPLTTGVTGTLPVANGGTGVTTSTGSGNNVLSTSPTLTTPNIGAATATSIAFSDGTQTKEGVASRTPINPQTASYTVVLSDRDSLVELNSASGVTVTIPTNATAAFPVGTSIDILQTGAGQITVAGAGGVTVNGTPGLKLRSQWSSATLFKRATDTWVVLGDLTV